MLNHDEPLPPLRAVEIMPVDHDGEPVFALIDRQQISPGPMAVSIAAYFVLAHLDGNHTIAQVVGSFQERFGAAPDVAAIEQLIVELDHALLLQNDRFERGYADRRNEFLAAATRDSRPRWPGPDTLRREITPLLDSSHAAVVSDLRGVIAPHLDYARGGPCYAAAYATLAQLAPADRYVILGTNHFGRAQSVIATRKAFQTPLGTSKVDVDLLSRLEQRLGQSLCEHEFDHAYEHSVELQVNLLQRLADGRPFEIVPLLCPDPAGPCGMQPADGRGPALDDFADALSELLAADDGDRRTVLIAGADLSHVGQRFGETEPTTPDFLAAIERSDRMLLSLLEQRQEEQFVSAVRSIGNATRICSVGCIYTLLRAIPEAPCRVLRYHQAVDYRAETHVTCAAAIVG